MRDTRPILIIEDDPDMSASLAQALEMAGYRVVTVEPAEEGMAMLEQGELPRLILLDLLLPGMGGFRFRATQLHHPSWAEIPVVLLTGDVDLSRSYHELGACELLEKPVDIGELLATVAHYDETPGE